MNRILALVTAVLLLPVLPGESQEAIWGGGEITSPEIHNDNTVTFRIMAPEAGEVKISGDWMPYEGWLPGSVVMNKDEKGLWTYTTAVLEPELYSYAFLVDGLRVSDQNNVYMIRDVATVTNVFIIGGGQADLYKVNEVPHGSVTRRWYDAPAAGMTRRMTVYTPPGYEKGKELYPVLYLLHGMGGDEEAWISLGRTAQIMDNLIASGKARPMIVVMPNGNLAQEAAPGESNLGFYKPTFQLPHTMDGMMEETFTDVMNFVEENYRVVQSKYGKAIAGLSMGGFHSLHISRYYPETFNYIGLFSPAILPREDASSKVYEDIDGTLQKQMENGYRLYWIGIGKQDFLYKNVEEYRAKLDSLNMTYTYVESEGGHTWRNWRVYLSEFVPLLFK